MFEELFRKSKGKPVVHKGQVLHLVDFVPCAQGDLFRITFEGTSSEWRQGIMLQAPGPLEVAGKTVPGPIVLWEDTAPKVTEVRIHAPTGPLQVKNVWDTGNGVVQSWHNGAAMIIDQTYSGRCYRCNDGHPDENFTDIVFRVEKVERC